MAFFAISDYSSMLNRIGWATFFMWVLALTALNSVVMPIHEILSQVMVKVPGTEFRVPAGVVLAAVFLAGLCRAVKLHDWVSDLFGIRRQFDVKEILLPMAAAAGVSLSLEQQIRVQEKRCELIGQVFYKYVSSVLSEKYV